MIVVSCPECGEVAGFGGEICGWCKECEMPRQYTVEKFKDMAASELRVRRNQAEKRVAEEAKRNAKLWGKPAAAAAALSGFKFKGK
jgi:hypothetical protein